jgi:predicted nucleotidyltransferase
VPSLPDLTASIPNGPAPVRAAIAAATEAWIASLGPRLVSIVLFGSFARGDATESSDADLLIVAEDFPRRLSARREELLSAYEPVRRTMELPFVEWNLVTKTPEEAREHSPLYLDMVEDGRLLFDRDGFFAGVLGEMRLRMRELGSRRVFLADGSWYWDLQPGFRFGGEVRI